MHHLVDLAPVVPRQLANKIGKNPAKDLPGPQSIGIRQCRAFGFVCAEMVELRSVTFQRSFDLTQALCPRHLPVNQRDQLAFRRQTADMLVGLVFIHKPIEAMPRHMLQYAVKHAIVVSHGVASFCVLIVG
jgi:hypothetical protein